MRTVILSGWNNQRTKLSGSQRNVLLTLLYKDVGDADSAGQALAVLNSHIKEDENNTVRHLVYIAFTTTNLADRHVALSGLHRVSPKHQDIATATFLHFLNHSNASNKDDALNLSSCITGLAKNSCFEALPKIREFTNNANKYLSGVAQQSVSQLEARTSSH